jgi:hypothetical protein
MERIALRDQTAAWKQLPREDMVPGSIASVLQAAVLLLAGAVASRR